MLQLQKYFEELDRIDSAEQLIEMRKQIKDGSYTKVFWEQWDLALNGETEVIRARARLKCNLIAKAYSASVAVNKNVHRFTTPHGLAGIHISVDATIGKGCTIFQHVVIGSNTLPDSKGQGFPVIGENVYIGAGAMIIGNVHVGNNVRIGANCVVTKDVPDNCLVVGSNAVIIPKDEPMNNKFISAQKFKKMLKETGSVIAEKTAVVAEKTAAAAELAEVTELPKAPVLPEELRQKFRNAIKIDFVGDLILLKDQVIKAYDPVTKKYNFDRMFEHVKPYFDQADLAIGVYEGPSAGAEVGYSTSNFGDGYALYLNYPDEFAQAVKNSGISLVTTANNHLLDRGIEGAMRTLDVLDSVGLVHTGSYRNQEEKDKLLVVDVKGVKIAVLSYLDKVNYFKTYELAENHPYLTSIMPYKNNPHYDSLVAEIKNDFKKAKKSGADLIMVLAHMGKQFSNETNAFQRKWNKVFSKLGADIILGDHTHAVQPVEFINNTLIVNCPGNFANSYVARNGDETAIVEIYIDKDSKKVIGSSVVPMYTQEVEKGYFRALPIYKAMTDKAIYDNLLACEIERIKAVQQHITEVMIGQSLTVEQLQYKYYFVDNQYYDSRYSLIESFDRYKDKEVYKMISNADRVGFIGDSITEGTKNDFHPWYEMLMEHFSDKQVVNVSKGGYTTKRIIREFGQDIINSAADIYFIALGTNDVRYRNAKNCAMTPQEYVEETDNIIKLARTNSPDAKFVLLPPWTTLDNDRVSKLGHQEKLAMIDQYGEALKKFAEENGHIFCNPNEYLREFYSTVNTSVYTKDGIHPTAITGIDLYCKAVLENLE